MNRRWRLAHASTGAGLATWLILHHLGRTYGSTRSERRQALPGDELVADAHIVATHATTIAAPPEQVWPWLLQMGWHRAGWYTARWVDRLLFPRISRVPTGSSPAGSSSTSETSFRMAPRRPNAGSSSWRRSRSGTSSSGRPATSALLATSRHCPGRLDVDLRSRAGDRRDSPGLSLAGPHLARLVDGRRPCLCRPRRPRDVARHAPRHRLARPRPAGTFAPLDRAKRSQPGGGGSTRRWTSTGLISRNRRGRARRHRARCRARAGRTCAQQQRW